MSDERFSSVPVGDRTSDCPRTPVFQQSKIVPVPVRQLNMQMDRHSVLRRYGMTVFSESSWAFESCFQLFSRRDESPCPNLPRGTRNHTHLWRCAN